jgi:S1-C subfamily serine protease
MTPMTGWPPTAAAPEGEAADARVGHTTTGDGEAVLLRGGVDRAPPRPALDAGDALVGIGVDAVQSPEVGTSCSRAKLLATAAACPDHGDSASAQRFHSRLRASLATMPAMTRPRSRRSHPVSPRGLRGLAAALTAFVAAAGLVGFAGTEAGAQSSGQGRVDVGAITSEVNPAVATISTTLAGGRGEAAGTGIVIGSSGEILTNNHVIENASSVRVRIGGTGRSYSAEVLGYNVAEDVALLKVDGVSGLDTVDTDDSVSVGEPVVALGNGGGSGGTPDATTGSVRAVGETIEVAASSGSQTLRNLIRVDAALEPGDSGGPLLDADGEVVGMNTAASSSGFRLRSGSGSGAGYAVPINTALSVAEQIKSGEGSGDTHVGERAFLGVSIRSLGTRGGSRSGAIVAGVQSNSPAEDAGIEQGDVIVSLAGRRITSIDDLTSALAPHHPRDKVEVGWTDESGDRRTAQVTLASGPPA